MSEFATITRSLGVERAMPHPPEKICWNAPGDQARDGLKTVVTWTPTPREDGTHGRMERSGFRRQDEAGYRGMGGGWPRILGRFEEIASRS
jgi:uncharacterized protein YndB with AHSA1/START domain